ncbi:hypothetical protein JCM6882_008034 [Rhodosporidiobolus microsporus]
MSTPQPPNGPSNPDANYRAILDYLTKRGHHKAALALTTDLEGSGAGGGGGGGGDASRPGSPAAAAAGGGKSVGLDDFAERNAPSAPRGGGAGGAAGGAGGQGQRRRMDDSVARGQMLTDPPSWEKGYEGLRAFVENSLDIHRPELHPLLLPLFVHSYLDLVLVGYRDAADAFLHRFSADHAALYPSLVRLLSSLRLPQHVSENAVALRWRQERYHVRLSERGWGLLLGWLQGGGVIGTEGTEGRGRDRVLAIINERVKVDAVPGPPLATSLTSHGLSTDYFSLQSGGLPAGAPPPGSGLDGAIPELKLGIPEVTGQLGREVRRRLRDEDGEEEEAEKKKEGGEAAAAGEGAEGAEGAPAGEGDGADVDASDEAKNDAPGAGGEKDKPPSGPATEKLLAPFPADLPPYPSTFRTLDVQREVELVREARKRVRLGAEAYRAEGQLVTAAAAAAAAAGGAQVGAGLKQPEREEKGKGVGKPSVCLFTVHDAGESVTTALFSADSSILAAGFGESYIRLWSLTGKGLRGLRTDLGAEEVGKVHDANDLKNLQSPHAPQTRKLIAHSGPIYSLSFDPIPGPSSPPRYMLSSSADATIRLWSLETYANLAVYRGHREPVWCVEWGPRGVYFASGSRDRTARLWISDKVNAVRIFAGHLGDVNCLSFHPNSLYLATGSSDRTLRLWDVQKGLCVRVFVGHRGSVMCCKVSPDGRWLASAGTDNLILLWSLSTGQRLKTLSGHTAPIHSLSFSAESTVLTSGAADDTVRVWDVLGESDSNDVEARLALSGGKGAGAAGAGAGGKLGGAPAGVKGRLGILGGAGGAGVRANGAAPNGAGIKEGKNGIGLDAAAAAKGDGGLGLVAKANGEGASSDLLATYATKRTNVLNVQFTPRNLCLAAGVMRES